VSQPRGPCWKLARRWRLLDLPARVLKSGRTGWYLRVLREGLLEAGQPVTLVERPFPEWTIAHVNTWPTARGTRGGRPPRLPPAVSAGARGSPEIAAERPPE
jgi:MOSC domain-containing protein YiiM